MRRSLIVLTAVAIAIPTAMASQPVDEPTTTLIEEPTTALIRECKSEAVRGHTRHLGTQRLQIDAHKKRMTELCEAWSDASSVSDGLLERCRAEAAFGARHIHRGWNFERAHKMRLQRICGELAALAR